MQTGLGRTGKMLGSDYGEHKPDLITLAKALSGGTFPISAVLGNDEVMNLLEPGCHGSTFGGSPLACAVGAEANDPSSWQTPQLSSGTIAAPGPCGPSGP